MTSTIFYKNKQYACEFVKNVKIEGEDIKGSFKVYVSRSASRAFLVDDFNKVIAQCIIFYRSQLDAILDEEDKHHEKEIKSICKNFADTIYLESWDEVEIKY